MNTKKKNRFLTFCFSLLPGAAEMYMGFMKTGLSLMGVFFLLITVSGTMNLGYIGVLAVVVWFYSFFHANHLASLADEEFGKVTDEYLFGMNTFLEGRDFIAKYQKWVAVGLIFLGVCFLWNSVADMLYNVLPENYHYIARIMWSVGSYVPSIVAGVLIIVIGIKLIAGKKMELADDSLYEETKEQEEK